MPGGNRFKQEQIFILKNVRNTANITSWQGQVDGVDAHGGGEVGEDGHQHVGGGGVGGDVGDGYSDGAEDDTGQPGREG